MDPQKCKKTVYLWGIAEQENGSVTVKCDFHSQAVLFLIHYCKSKAFKVCFVSTKKCLPCRLCSKVLTGLSVEFASQRDLPREIQGCGLPAVASESDHLIRVGLGCTLRHIVMLQDQIIPNCGLITLLGLKSACLKSCAESSVWTKFCEVEIGCLLEKVLQENESYVHLNDKTEFTVAVELVKLENHFHSPPIIHNISKHRREAVKRKLQQRAGCDSNATDGQSVKNQVIEELEHRYVEGTHMTISDLVIYPAFCLLLDRWQDFRSDLEKQLPRITGWMRLMQQQDDVRHAQDMCDLPPMQLSSSLSPVIHMPTSTDALLNIREIKRKLKVKSGIVDELQKKLEMKGIAVRESNHPWTSLELPWEDMPSATHPKEGELPVSRLERKCQQLENLVAGVRWLAKPGHTIVDFCAGGGHVGILLAYLLPECHVVMVENKEESITRAQNRVKLLGLQNVTLYQSNLDFFQGDFDIGVSLHACGVATDLVLQTCLKKQAAFVLCPCCYGGIHDNHVTTYPRSQIYKAANLSIKEYEILGHAADQTEVASQLASQGKLCMQLIDTDRLAEAQEHGYQVVLTSLIPLSCSPKNNLLLGLKPRDKKDDSLS